MLEVRSLTKYYGSVRGVENLTFAIESGEIFGYLGPNGSGKTTTLRCIMGLLKPTGGVCRVFGEQVVAGRATHHLRIGYLPGDFRIWPRLTARRALKMLAALGNRDRARARREELAERLGLDLDRPVGDLSKGNRQKVGVIYAFQQYTFSSQFRFSDENKINRTLLILDEPTIGLDPLMRQIVLDLIREAADAGATVLLSSHNLSEVAAVCGRAGILREGRLVEVAPISDILQQGEHHLEVWFADGDMVPKVPAEQLPGVRLIQQQPGMLHLAYQGSSDAVLKWLAQFPVERIATPQTSLEEAFMQYYKQQPDATAKAGNDATQKGGHS